MGMTKHELLKRLPRGVVRDGHRLETKAFIRRSAEIWEAADEATRQDIVAFFESDGPVKIEALKRVSRLGLN
jgi:hypothetical protein